MRLYDRDGQETADIRNAVCGVESMIIDKAQLADIATRYLGGEDGKQTITDDEREILLFALYIESTSKGGLMSTAVLEATKNKLKWETIT